MYFFKSTPFQKGIDLQKNKQEVTKFGSLDGNGESSYQVHSVPYCFPKFNITKNLAEFIKKFYICEAILVISAGNMIHRKEMFSLEPCHAAPRVQMRLGRKTY